MNKNVVSIDARQPSEPRVDQLSDWYLTQRRTSTAWHTWIDPFDWSELL